MPPLSAADAFLVLDFLAGHRLLPHHVFASLLASLPPLSHHRSSPRLRKALALRALDAALSDAASALSVSDAAAALSTLLCKARALLARPDLASCFPDHLSLPDCRDDAAAAVAHLKRLLDLQWAHLPPSTLEIAADRIAGAGALQTWANADTDKRQKLRLLVGESTEREILAKLEQDPSVMAPQVDKAANGANTSAANEAVRAQQHVEAHLVRENGKADHAQQDAQLLEKFVTGAAINGEDTATSSHVSQQIAPDNNKSHPVTGSKRSLMERNPTASIYEWDGSGDSDPEWPSRMRQLPTYEKKPKPSPTFPHKTRKKWSEIQEKTLMEGVEKYGKGNWKDIKLAYPDVFEDRSTVDMKDKFRNMERH